VNLSQKKIETIQNQTYQNVVNSQDTGNKSNNQIQLAAPTIPDIKYDSFQSALDSLKSTVEKSPITAFNKLNGVQANERDKKDFIATIDSERIRYKSNPAGVSYKLITTLQTGILYPNCKKGNGIDPSCGDFDRNFKLTPNLKLSLELSKIANSEKIRSDKLAIHYMNGWGVEKDLLKAYELFESDKLKSGVVSEYWWVNINSMIQKELKNLGAKIEVDGDFGASSCKTLSEFIGVTKCGRVVTKEQVYALISKNKKSIE
jgi:hypothetical protein